MQASVNSVERNVQLINIWLKELSEELGGIDQEEAWTRLRAVLQTVRDRITIDEAADFAAQLPIMIRGVFYEGWHPADVPKKWRDRDEYLGSLNEKMSGRESVDPEATLKAALRVIDRNIDSGELKKVKEMHPQEIWDLWPA